MTVQDLTDSVCMRILEARRAGVGDEEIARRYGISKRGVHKAARRAWAKEEEVLRLRNEANLIRKSRPISKPCKVTLHCHQCHGTGRYVGIQCHACGGLGRIVAGGKR